MVFKKYYVRLSHKFTSFLMFKVEVKQISKLEYIYIGISEYIFIFKIYYNYACDFNDTIFEKIVLFV